MSDAFLDASKPKLQSKEEHELLQSSKNVSYYCEKLGCIENSHRIQSAQAMKIPKTKIPKTEIDDQGRSYVAAYAAPRDVSF